MDTTKLHAEDVLSGYAFRPWNVDALATIESARVDSVTIRYDHAPQTPYTLSHRDAAKIGRVVTRGEFR